MTFLFVALVAAAAVGGGQGILVGHVFSDCVVSNVEIERDLWRWRRLDGARSKDR